MGEREPVYCLRPWSLGNADLRHAIDGIDILLTILDRRRLTVLYEDVWNVVYVGLASFAKVSNGIDARCSQAY